MKTLTVIAVIKAKPGKEEATRSALLALVAPTRAERGCINYDLHVSTESPGHFAFHENWSSKADLDAHLASPHLAAVIARIPELLAEPPQITLWEQIA